MLAIDGGKPVRSTPFPSWPTYGEEERAALVRVLEQGTWWRGDGKEVAQFESEFATFHGVPYSLAVSNGTHALEVALLAHGVGSGDEVIVPAFTFISTVTAVQRIGAIPIVVDCDLHNFNISPQSVVPVVRDKTKAVIPVHISGNPVDMRSLVSALGGQTVAIIQDASHAHSMKWADQPVGALSETACFSFQNAKLMTAGEGGAILFQNEDVFKRAFLFHNCGRAAGDVSYDHMVVGSNYRLNEFSAALLREQLKRLPEQTAIRETNALELRSYLGCIKGILLQARFPGTTIHSNYMVLFRLDRNFLPEVSRDWFVEALKAEGLPAFRAYRPVFHTEAFWLFTYSREKHANLSSCCPNALTLGEDGIWLHHKVLLGGYQEVQDVVKAIEKVISSVARVSGVAP